MKAWQLYLHVKVQPRLFNFSHSLKNLEGKKWFGYFSSLGCFMQFENVQETGKCMNENMQEQIVCLSSYSDNIHNIKIPLSLSFPSPAPPKKGGGGKELKAQNPYNYVSSFKKKSAYENQQMFMNKLFYGKHQLE